jgi:hypothetical protein
MQTAFNTINSKNQNILKTSFGFTKLKKKDIVDYQSKK